MDSSELPLRSSELEHDQSRTHSDVRALPAAAVGGGGVGGGGARYKLMSPAKLPISRSPCITIPPGLSPTSFLESPVLLSNVKVEPSPTTGSFAKFHMMLGSVGSKGYMAMTNCSDGNSLVEDERKAFEFKPPPNSNLGTTESNHQGTQSFPIQGQLQSQPFASMPFVRSDFASSSKELSLSTPANLASGVSTPPEVDSEDFQQNDNTNPGIQSNSDQKTNGSAVAAERLSDDGYNWRKYGQKHVKGSEFPRSYYKCTHPNCEVKKLFERAPDGHITEIIYKGTHDHPKPQPSRRFTASTMMQNQEEKSDKFQSQSAGDRPSNMYSQIPFKNEQHVNHDLSPVIGNEDSVDIAASISNNIHDELDEDDPFSKRRRMDMGGMDVTPIVKPIREPRVVVQTVSEVDILDDGYRWRKYGQKVVRGNPNPRSYYKCTNAGCPVRKHVERASHDPKAVITTYEGKHNHDVPTARTSSHDMAGPSAPAAPSPMRLEENETISLDLGVGISSAAESKSIVMHPQFAQSHINFPGSNLKALQATTVSTHYGVEGSGKNQYVPTENFNGGHSVEIPPLNHSSYPYPQNMGRILTGP